VAFQSTRRGGSGFGRSTRRGRPDDDPLNPDVVPGSPEDEMGDPESVARGICLRALTGAPKTRSQLADLLATRGVPEDAAETVLDRFTEVGLIDDAAFARAWVSSRQSGRGLARRALSAELRAKGVDPEVAAEAVEAVDDDDERASARRLVDRKVGAMRRLDRATATRRLMGMLARKGYSGGLAAAVVREALDSADAGDLEDSGVPGFDDLDEDSLLP
jgi:regulatory protein